MIKLLYDISVLGLGYRNPTCRAGIFRVSEMVAHGLVSQPELAVTLCAGASFGHLQEAIAYHQATPQLAATPLTYSQAQRWVYHQFNDGIASRLKTVNRQLEKATGFPALGLKVLRKPLFYGYLLMSGLSSLEATSLETAQIYHSPFYPVPERVRQTPTLKPVLTLHDLIPLRHPEFFAGIEESLIQDTLQSLDHRSWIICVSEFTKQDLCHYRPDLDPARMRVIPWAASDLFYPCTDPERLQAVQQTYHLPEGPYLLSLSTLEPRKNLDHLIRSFAQLIQQQAIPDLSLVLVGHKGWKYEAIFETLAQADQVRDRIHWLGYVDDADLAAVYSGALAFVYPSFYEGFGLPPLEAMQCGVPVITSNTSSLPEVVGSAGILLDPRDQDGLCQALLTLYRDSHLRSRLAAQSLVQAAQFSWDRCIQETVEFYRQALTD